MTSKAERRRQKQANRKQSPSAPRVIGANDNLQHGNDNDCVSVGGVALNAKLSAAYRKAVVDVEAVLVDADGETIRLASGDPTPDIGRRREGHQALMEIEMAITEHLDAERMQAVRQEISALEKRRGSELTETRLRDRRGQEGVEYRVKRDGLSTLSIARTDRSTNQRIPPSLTKTQATAGLYYRTDYERIDPERVLTPPTLLRDGKTRAGGGEGFDKKVAESWQRVRTIHLLIAGLPLEVARRTGGEEYTRPNMPNLPASHPAMRAILALNEIAGKGASISDLVTGGHARAKMLHDLITALRACQIVYAVGEPDPTG
jgi:hypothetical protein